jgi:predicted phosphate transport protein (TIGR00153 family)
MVLRLFPREESFYELFRRAADNILEAALLLRNLFDDYRDVEARAAAIKNLEDRGDAITHEIIERLNRTFVTPFDRDDVYELARQLDNVVDWIEAAAARLAVYRIPRPTREAQEMARIIVSAAEAIVEAIGNLRTLDRLPGPVREINRLENLADHVQRDAVAALFASTASAIDIMKWKEIYETLEEATDQAEDVANVLDTIRTKQT